MKTSFNIIFCLSTIVASAQTKIPEDLIFNKNVVEAENHWVARTPRGGESGLHYSYVFFDEKKEAYFLRSDGFFSIQNNVLVNDASQFHDGDLTTANNLEVKVAILNDTRLKELGLSNKPAWLKDYDSIADPKEKLFVRASALNDMRAYDTSILILEGLLKDNYTNKGEVYHLLTKAYSATKQFSKTDDIIKKAASKGFPRDNFYCDLIYNFALQNKWKEAEEIASTAVANKNTPDRNMVLYTMVYSSYLAKEFDRTQKWIDISRKEMTTGGDNLLSNFKKMEARMQRDK